MQRPVVKQIDYLIGLVDALESAETLNGGQANALRAKLEAASKTAARGMGNPAAGQLGAFINQVEALAAAGILPAADAEALIGAAVTVLASLD